MNYLYYEKMARGIFIFLWLFAVLAIASCSTQVHRAQEQSVERVENSGDSLATKSKDLVTPLIIVKDAKIYAWWWEKSVSRAGFDGDRPPPKTRYAEIEKWEYDGDGITTAPHELDFISNLANGSSTDFQGVVKFQLSARFEDYDKFVSIDSHGASVFLMDEFEKVPWTDVAVIFRKKVVLEAKKEKKIEVKGHDTAYIWIREVNEKRICALRFVVQITDMSGKHVASKETVMHVLLGD